MYFIHYAFDIHRIGETLWRGNGTIDVTSVIMIICYKKWSFTLMSDEKWSLGNLHFSNGRWFPGYIYIYVMYIYIYIKYTHKETYTTYPLFLDVAFWVYPIRDNLNTFYGSALPLSSPVPHIINLQTPTRTSQSGTRVPGWRSISVLVTWSDDFFGAFFFVVGGCWPTKQAIRKWKEKNLSFFGGWGDAGWDVFRQVFFWKEKNHLEWVGIFSFLPQLGSSSVVS